MESASYLPHFRAACMDHKFCTFEFIKCDTQYYVDEKKLFIEFCQNYIRSLSTWFDSPTVSRVPCTRGAAQATAVVESKSVDHSEFNRGNWIYARDNTKILIISGLDQVFNTGLVWEKSDFLRNTQKLLRNTRRFFFANIYIRRY